ncbi:MAG: hypothetical protein KC425_12250 [Anaerolineales bacterium]|nr:hypothetical protein [Anaerolineales bacterium]
MSVVVVAAQSGEMGDTAVAPAGSSYTYLPFVRQPSAGVPGLLNPSFEDGWTDLPPAPGFLINQQPTDWTLTWVEPGQPLYDTTDLAGGVPECIHKLNNQLPPDEQYGGPKALILHGLTTYKLFHANAPFGAELRQTITGLPPGSSWTILVPMQLHIQGAEPDPYGAEAGVWVNGIGSWVNITVLGDRQWYEHRVTASASLSGELELVIRVKSKWARGKDFFIDHLRLLPAP